MYFMLSLLYMKHTVLPFVHVQYNKRRKGVLWLRAVVLLISIILCYVLIHAMWYDDCVCIRTMYHVRVCILNDIINTDAYILLQFYFHHFFYIFLFEFDFEKKRTKNMFSSTFFSCHSSSMAIHIKIAPARNSYSSNKLYMYLS